MKLLKAIRNHIRQIDEAARFGNKEMQLLKQHMNEFSIGVEYEFHVDGAGASEEMGMDEIDREEALSLARDHVASVNEIFEDLDDVMSTFRANDLYNSSVEDSISNLGEIARAYMEGIATKVDVFSSFDEEMKNEDLSLFSGYAAVVVKMFDLDEQLREALTELDSDFFPDSFSKYFGKLNGIIDEATIAWENNERENVADLVIEIEEEIDWEDLTYDMANFQATIQPHRYNPSELVESLVEETSAYEDQVEDAVDNVYAENNVYGEGESAVEIVNSTIAQYVNAQKISQITTDPSVENGVEVITRPLSLKETFEVMKQMFDYIDQYGSTSNRTGMHVNISHNDFKTSSDIDFLKMLLLIDPQHMQSTGDVFKWKERNHFVSGIYNDVMKNWDDSLNQIMKSYDEGGIVKVEQTLRQYLIRPEKYKSINFSHVLGSSASTNGSRVEFRFFGGQDYEDRYSEIFGDVNFLCYTILAATDPQFLRREYLKEIARLLNKISKSYAGVSFVELYNEWSKYRDAGMALTSITDKFAKKGYNYK